jgi:hypothetical protein
VRAQYPSIVLMKVYEKEYLLFNFLGFLEIDSDLIVKCLEALKVNPEEDLSEEMVEILKELKSHIDGIYQVTTWLDFLEVVLL